MHAQYSPFSKIFVIIGVILFLFCSCEQKKVSLDQVMLQIDDITFTKYELDKFLTDRLNPSGFKKEEVEDICNQFVNRSILNVVGSTSKFGLEDEVTKFCNYWELDQVSKVGGIHWKKMVQPSIAPTEKELALALVKAKTKYQFAVSQFHSKEQYDFIMSKVASVDSVFSYSNAIKYGYAINPNMDLVWPFANYWESRDQMFVMRDGDTLSYPSESGFQFLLLIKKSPIELSEDKITKLVRDQVMEVKKKDIIRSKQLELESNSKIVYNVNVVRELFSYLDSLGENQLKSNQLTGDNIRYKALEQKVICGYKLDSKDYGLTVAEYLDWYDHSIVRYVINHPDQLISSSTGYIHQKHLLIEAKTNRVLTDPIYQLSKQYFQRDIQQHLFKEKLKDTVIISDAEKERYYKNNTSEFILCDSARFLVLKFQDEQSAFNFTEKVLPNNSPQELFRKLEADYQFEELASFENTSFGRASMPFGDQTDRVFDLPELQTLEPFFFENQFYITIKIMELKHFTMKYDWVKHKIEAKLILEKQERSIQRILEEANEKRQIKIYFNYNDVYNEFKEKYS